MINTKYIEKTGMGILPMGPGQRNLENSIIRENILYGVAHGLNFMDTAQYYGMYDSFSEIDEEVLSGLELCSKSLADGYDEMREAVTEALDAFKRESIDVFLMHEVRSGQLVGRKEAWRALQDMKREGLIKAIGLSTHHVDIVESCIGLEGCDVVFAILNHKGMGIRRGQNPAPREEMEAALKACHEKGIRTMAMKVFGGGNLTSEYLRSLDYIYSQDYLDTVVLGFASEKEIDDFENYSNGMLEEGYNPDVSMKKVRVNHEDCEGCGACMKACGSSAVSWSSEDGLAVIDPEKCITCGYCAMACPTRAVIMY